MSSRFPSRKEAEAKPPAAKASSRSTDACAFCDFVLSLYPTLTRMKPSDSRMFTEHLKESHGLVGEIEP
jgi:hypothetical protein